MTVAEFRYEVGYLVADIGLLSAGVPECLESPFGLDSRIIYGCSACWLL
jgi:hypothetical protein